MKNPTFTIDFGCMFSGKSQELYRRCSKFVDSLVSVQTIDEERKVDRVLLITHKGQEGRKVASHSKGITTHAENFHASPFLNVREVFRLSEIEDKELENVTFIGIDESFYPDLYVKVKEWFLGKRISISISCLDGDFRQEILSPQIMQLIPYTTKIIKHSAYCHICLEEGIYENAYYTIKIKDDKDKVDFGGAEKYKAVCFNHLRH